MGEAFKSLGIDLTSLLAQAVNFGLLFFILWKFLYTPILKMLNGRTEKIEESLKKADAISKEYEEIEKHKEKLTLAAEKEANKIIEAAKKEGKQITADYTFEAETKAKAILANAEIVADKEKGLLIESAKDDIAKLIEESLTSILKNDAKKYDDALINEALAGFVESK